MGVELTVMSRLSDRMLLPQSVTIEVVDPLSPKEGTRVLGILHGCDPRAMVVVDVRAVDRFEDHVLADIAHALSSREGSGSFVGLPLHHSRILRYLHVSLRSH